MVFWGKQNDEDLPPELRGKKPEEIVAALKAADDAKKAATDAEAARVAAEAKVTARDSEFEQMRTRMAELEANQKPPEKVDPPEPTSPWVDPEKFVQEQTQRTTMVALASGIMSAKMYFMQGLTARDQKIFKKYEKEVETTVGTFIPEQRVMPQSWQNAFLYVKGLHDVDIHKAESTSTDFFSEPASRGTQDHQEDHDDTKLTADEEEVCRRFHFDPKSYLERKKAGTLAASEKGQYARYPVKTSS